MVVAASDVHSEHSDVSDRRGRRAEEHALCSDQDG
jgi:hypothetical protein